MALVIEIDAIDNTFRNFVSACSFKERRQNQNSASIIENALYMEK